MVGRDTTSKKIAGTKDRKWNNGFVSGWVICHKRCTFLWLSLVSVFSVVAVVVYV